MGSTPPEEQRLRQPRGADDPGTIVRQLEYLAPYAPAPLLGFLAARAVPGVEEGSPFTYRRTVRLPHATGLLSLTPAPERGHITARLDLEDPRDVTPALQRCRRLFDLDADPEVVAEVLGRDPILALLVGRNPGLRVPGDVDGFELAVRAILGQQVTVKGARTLAERLVRKLGAPLTAPDGSLTHLFPDAQVMADDDLSGIGLTRARVRALRALADAVAHGSLVLHPRADRSETRRALLDLPGVGQWTADYIGMRALGDPDAIPLTDLGLSRAWTALGGPGGAKGLADHAERWRPWRSYAAIHLWTYLSQLTSAAR